MWQKFRSRDCSAGRSKKNPGGITRIEPTADDATKAAQTEMTELIYKKFRKIGFTYIAIDLLGYRTGNLNEALSTLVFS